MQTTQMRSNVTIDDRRAVMPVAAARKAKDVAAVPHEAFIRNALKDRLGWPRRDPAPQAVLDAAKQMAAFLKARDLEVSKKIMAEKAAKEANEAAVAHGIADNV